MFDQIDNKFIPIAPKAKLLSTLSLCPRWPALLLCMLLVPNEFSFAIGSLRFTLYRVILIAAFLPCLLRIFSGRAGRLSPVDIFLGIHLFWSCVVLTYHHGSVVAIETGGIRVLEVGGAYLVARACILSERDFRGFVAFLTLVVCLLAPMVLFESVTGVHLIRELSAKLSGSFFYSEIETRFGFHRAYGPFGHPIHLGVFGASCLGLFWIKSLPRMGSPETRRLPCLAAVITAIGSLSAGAAAALGVQFFLLFWGSRTQLLPYRWRVLTVLIVGLYFAVDLISNRTGIQVFLQYLTFNQQTAYYRTIIFEWGMKEVWRNPLFGIGLNDWVRPAWMYSSSMDNFWLLQATTFGILGFSSLAFAILFLLGRGWDRLPPRLTRLRMGWTISMIGMIIAGCTVHFWNNLFVYFFLFSGAGAWFMSVERKEQVEFLKKESSNE